MQGVIVTAPTPIDVDRAPIKKLFLEHCQWALANGCDRLNILGSTGEARSFDLTSRHTVMFWAAEGFMGIKESSGDLNNYPAIVTANSSLKVFPSSETALESVKADGFSSGLSASVNLTAILAGQIWTQCKTQLADLSVEVVRRLGGIAGLTLIANVKSLVAGRAKDPCWRAVLPPFRPLHKTVKKNLKTTLEG